MSVVSFYPFPFVDIIPKEYYFHLMYGTKAGYKSLFFQFVKIKLMLLLLLLLLWS